MGCLKKVFSNPVTQIVSDLVAAGTGNPELIPVINAGETKLGGGSWGDAAKSGAISFGGQELGGLAGNLINGDGGNSLTDAFGLTDGAGSLAGPGTLGGDFLGDFAPGSALDAAFGAAPGVGSSLGSDFANGLTGATAEDPITSAARSAISDSSTAAAPTSTGLTGYLPGGGQSIAGGGTTGGFFSPDNLSSGTDGLQVGQVYDRPPAASPTPTFGSDLTGQFAAGLQPTAPTLTSDPLGYLSNKAIQGASNVFDPSSLLKAGLKGGLTYALQKNNTGGYNALQTAAANSATNYQPFLAAGTGATNTLADLSGTNGQAAATAATQNWQNTPGYNFALDQGIKSLDASAASRGNLVSGNNQQAVQQYGTGLANQYYQQYLQNLQQQAGQGITAAQGVGQGNIDAATAFAAGKGNSANNFNSTLRGLLSYI